jgi:hypothetical protein
MITRRTRLPSLIVAALALVAASALTAITVQASSAEASTAPAWSVLTPIEASTSGGQVGEVSCASPKLCAALWAPGGDDEFDEVVFSHGGEWGNPVALHLDFADLDALSCVGLAFCLAVDDDGAGVTFDGSKWSDPLTVPGEGQQQAAPFTAVSCASPSFCVAVDTAGDAVAFVNGHWARPVSIDNGHLLTAVSCDDAGRPYCMVVDGVGNAIVFDRGHWMSPTRIDTDALTAVACGGTSHCVAADSLAQLYSYEGAWSRANNIDLSGESIASISCGTPNICVAVDGRERTVAYENSRWQAPRGHDRTSIGLEVGLPGLTSISCPTSRFCLAIDASSNSLTFSG